MLSLLKKVIILVIIVIVIYSFTIITLAPFRKIAELNQFEQIDTATHNGIKTHYKNETLFELVKTKAFEEAKIELAKKDSIGLIINLIDSTATLYMKGVNIHQSKIEFIDLDNFYKALSPITISKMFSKPFAVTSHYSSIVKEPIVIKKAPKNEEEAELMVSVPEAPVRIPTYLSFNLNEIFNLVMVQNEWNTKEDRKIERKFKNDLRKRKISDAVNGVIHLKQIFYTPTIILTLKNDEISSIYRALPVNAHVVIKY